jgi:hypothetical protein
VSEAEAAQLLRIGRRGLELLEVIGRRAEAEEETFRLRPPPLLKERVAYPRRTARRKSGEAPTRLNDRMDFIVVPSTPPS